MLDVVLFCEGTYPFISGGVSSWIHALLSAMPEIKFGIVFLSPGRSFKKELKYTLPPNLREFVEVYLYDVRLVKDRPPASGAAREAAWNALEAFSTGLVEGQWVNFSSLFRDLGCVGPEGRPLLSMEEMAYSPRAWEILVKLYNRSAPDLSFVDFFWTWRFIHFPLFQLLHAPIPAARCYHTVTTGWSGLLATMATLRTGAPMLLTEHGIYTNERRIEIVKADWIHVETQRLEGSQSFGFLKSLWIHLFEALGRLCYEHAREILTLYDGNRQKQLAAGAPKEKIRIIPNGVRIDVFESVPQGQLRVKPEGEFAIGFVGRIVPIKDVLTLIRACRSVNDRVPQARTYLIGPTDEDPEYYRECQNLVNTLGLQDQVRFTGPQDVKAWYPTLDVLVLTSISEGQPLVILEAFVAGVPCVATDVGGCSEILLGGSPEDKALGSAGFVTQVGSPQSTAAAILRLATDPQLRRTQSLVGQRRVRQFYDHLDMIREYRELYLTWMGEEASLGGNRL